MSSSISSLEQLYNDLSIQNSPTSDPRLTQAEPVPQYQQSMDPFTAPTPPQIDAVSSSNPFRTMPQPLQPSLPEAVVPASPVSSRSENTNPAALVQMYMDRMSKMMVAMDERMTRLETLMSHNLFLLHQQHQQQAVQGQQQQQPKHSQEEDLESALKEQVKLELEHAKKMQAQFEKDGEIAKKIQAQMDDEFFTEERKKFYTQPQTSLVPRPSFTPSRRPMPGFDECPVCLGHVKQNELEAHVYACLDGDKNMDANGKPKVVDKPSFLARLFGGPKKEVSEERAPLVTSAQPVGGAEYAGHPGSMYPGISYPPMYPMPSSPYMHPSQAPAPFYYYVPQPHHA